MILSVSAIWMLAHIFAAPGSSVSVLWGLVQYTKRGVLKPAALRNLPADTYPVFNKDPTQHESKSQADYNALLDPPENMSCGKKISEKNTHQERNENEPTYVQRIELSKIQSYFNHMTEVTAKNIMHEMYSGKRLRFLGNIENVSAERAMGENAQLQQNYRLSFNIDHMYKLFVYMKSEESKRITHLNRGDQVKIEATINVITELYMWLEDGVVIFDNAEPLQDVVIPKAPPAPS